LTMPTNVPESRHRPADSEKITINLGYVDLGHVDLMVRDGFYSNRTDFIRTAIRNQLDRHADVVRQSVSRKALELGSDIIVAPTSRRHGRGAICCISMSWASPVLLTTLRLNWRVHPSPQSRCWAPCRQVPRSKRHSPTEHTDVATQQGLPHHNPIQRSSPTHSTIDDGSRSGSELGCLSGSHTEGHDHELLPTCRTARSDAPHQSRTAH
jgi:Arc/MetJ-type ribon-helix-helix transcriptional regulator